MGIPTRKHTKTQGYLKGQALVEHIAKDTGCRLNDNGQYIDGSCPVHGHKNNFSVSLGENGMPILKCFAGCENEKIVDHYKWQGVWPQGDSGFRRSTAREDFAQFATGSDTTTGGKTKNPTAKALAKRAYENLLAERERQEKQDAAKEAWQTIHDCDPAKQPDEHPYNQERGGMWTGGDARRGYWKHNGKDPDALILPFADAKGKIWTTQAIGSKELKAGNGKARKVFLKDGLSKGSFYSFTPTADPRIKTFLIAEGFFTAQAACHCFLNQDDGSGEECCFVVAGSVYNLVLVAYQLKAAHPAADIIILADEGSIEAAEEAARVTDGKVARPSAGLSGGEEPRHGYDFWDLHKEHGAAAVIKAINAATEPPPEEPNNEEPPLLKDTAEAADREQQQARTAEAEEAQRRARLDELKAEFWARRVSPKRSIESEPPERGHIIQGYIVERIVCAFSGEGGGGKSYQCLKMGLAISSGKRIEIFDPPKKGPVIYLSAEDDEGILWWRMHHLAAMYELSPYEVEEVERNFHPIDAGGFFKPIMQCDRNGNPCESIYGELLREIIADINPALVIVDPKAEFYGVEENANEDAAAWTGTLKSMIAPGTRTAFLVVSHIAKGLDEDQREQAHAARGGTAFIDACRAAMNYVPARASEVKKYDLPQGAFKLKYTKGNYHKWPEDAFFVKDEYGIPVMVDTEAIKTAKAAAAYEEAVRLVPYLAKAAQDKGEPLNKKKWERRLGEPLPDPKKPNPEQQAHDAMIAKGIGFDQVATAIAEAIRRGYVKATKGERTAKTGPAPIVIEFAEFPPELNE